MFLKYYLIKKLYAKASVVAENNATKEGFLDNSFLSVEAFSKA